MLLVSCCWIQNTVPGPPSSSFHLITHFCTLLVQIPCDGGVFSHLGGSSSYLQAGSGQVIERLSDMVGKLQVCQSGWTLDEEANPAHQLGAEGLGSHGAL